MKILTIFQKNLKTISRNWNYFLVLFICPIILILVTGAMLNSSNFDNVKIGLVDNDPGFTVNLGGFKNIQKYSNIGDCLYFIEDKKVSLCLHLREDSKGHQVDVYVDNTRKAMASFIKQFVLQKILDEQTYALEETAETLNYKLSLFSTSLDSAKEELEFTQSELDESERMLMDYRTKLLDVKSKFNIVYYRLKYYENDVREIQGNANSGLNDFESNIELIREYNNDVLTQVYSLRNHLNGVLTYSEYSYVNPQINEVVYSLEEVNQILNTLQYNSDYRKATDLIKSLATVYDHLEEIKLTLDTLENDLDNAIIRVRETRNRLDNFIFTLENSQNELDEFSEQVDANKVGVNFKDVFTISDNPVFLAFPLLMSIILAFTAVILSNMFVLKQVNEPSYFRDIMTPTRDTSFLIADYLVNLFFVAIEMIVLFFIGIFWVGIPAASFYSMIIPMFLAASIFIFVGMGLGYFFKSQNLSMLISIFLVMLFFLFSDILSSSQLVSPVVRFFMYFNPFFVLNSVLFDSFLLNKPLTDIMFDLNVLIVMLIGAAIFVYIAKKISKKHVME
jgi:hypothetical protein